MQGNNFSHANQEFTANKLLPRHLSQQQFYCDLGMCPASISLSIALCMYRCHTCVGLLQYHMPTGSAAELKQQGQCSWPAQLIELWEQFHLGQQVSRTSNLHLTSDQV